MDWRVLTAQLDNIVDQQWAEPVELHPMLPGSVATEPGPDPSRPVESVQAVFMKPGATITGEAGVARAYGGNVQQIQQDTWISICNRQLGDIKQWQKGDRIFLPYRNEWYEINYIDPSATLRPCIYLLRVQDVDV